MTSEEDFAEARGAARRGDVSAVEAWLSRGVDVNREYVYGPSKTLLSAAILGRQTQMCEYLVARGARCRKSGIYHLLDEILASPSHVDVARLFICLLYTSPSPRD